MYFGKMNGLDIAILILFAIGVFRGLFKGLVLEVAGLIALVLGILGAFRFSNLMSAFLTQWVDWNPKWIQTISFILLFILIVYAISLLAKMLTKALNLVALGGLNKLLGAAVGGLKFILLLAAFVLLFENISEYITFFSLEIIETSTFYPMLLKIGSLVFDWVFQSNALKNMDQLVSWGHPTAVYFHF